MEENTKNKMSTEQPQPPLEQPEISDSRSIGNFFERSKERFSSFLSTTANKAREKGQNNSFGERKKEIETGEDLKNFLSEIRGKQIEKASTTKNPLPLSFGIGIAGGVLRSQALEVGLDVTEAAPLVAAGASIARDTYRILTAEEDVIATLAARYVKEKPGTAATRVDQQEEQPKKGFKEKVVSGLAKVGWWSQIVERTAVKAITKKELKEESRTQAILEFINSNLDGIDDINEYLSDTKGLRRDLNEWFKEEKETDRTGHLIETFGFLTDAKTLNNYRDIEGLQNLSGGSKDEAVVKLETLRNSLHDIVLRNLYGTKNLGHKDTVNEYIDQLTQYKWGTGRKVKYAGAIMAVGAGMSAVKAFAGVKAVDVVRHFTEEVQESGIIEEISERAQELGQEAKEAIKEVGEKTGQAVEGFGEKTGEMARELTHKITGTEGVADILPAEGVTDTEVFLPHVAKGAGHTGTFIPHVVATQERVGLLDNIFDKFADSGEAPWDTGAQAGDYLSSQINMGDLKESWMHGDIEVPRGGAFKNFFGHWVSEGGPLDKETGLKMAENLKDALLLDQENFMDMAHLVRDLKEAVTAEELQEILTSMPKDDALKAAYFSYAEGLIKNSDLKQTLVDFIKNNT